MGVYTLGLLVLVIPPLYGMHVEHRKEVQEIDIPVLEARILHTYCPKKITVIDENPVKVFVPKSVSKDTILSLAHLLAHDTPNSVKEIDITQYNMYELLNTARYFNSAQYQEIVSNYIITKCSLQELYAKRFMHELTSGALKAILSIHPTYLQARELFNQGPCKKTLTNTTVTSMAIGQGSRVVIGSSNGALDIIPVDLSDSVEVNEQENNKEPIEKVAVNNPGSYMACVRQGTNSVEVWNITNQTKEKTFSEDRCCIKSLAFGPNATWLAVVYGKYLFSKLVIYDVKLGTVIKETTANSDLNEVRFVDQNHLIGMSKKNDKTHVTCVWHLDLSSGKEYESDLQEPLITVSDDASHSITQITQTIAKQDQYSIRFWKKTQQNQWHCLTKKISLDKRNLFVFSNNNKLCAGLIGNKLMLYKSKNYVTIGSTKLKKDKEAQSLVFSANDDYILVNFGNELCRYSVHDLTQLSSDQQLLYALLYEQKAKPFDMKPYYHLRNAYKTLDGLTKKNINAQRTVYDSGLSYKYHGALLALGCFCCVVGWLVHNRASNYL